MASIILLVHSSVIIIEGFNGAFFLSFPILFIFGGISEFSLLKREMNQLAFAKLAFIHTYNFLSPYAYGYYIHVSYGLSYHHRLTTNFPLSLTSTFVSPSVYFFFQLIVHRFLPRRLISLSLQVTIIRTLSPEIISFYLYWYRIHMSGYHLCSTPVQNPCMAARVFTQSGEQVEALTARPVCRDGDGENSSGG